MKSFRFATWTFRLAGIYGLVVILLGYFSEPQIGRDYPPAVTHVEYFYGFMGLALTFQLIFLLISTDPLRYRPLMLLAVMEKLVFFVPAMILFARHQLPPPTAGGAAIDLVFAVLFLMSYFRTSPASPAVATIAAP